MLIIASSIFGAPSSTMSFTPSSSSRGGITIDQQRLAFSIPSCNSKKMRIEGKLFTAHSADTNVEASSSESSSVGKDDIAPDYLAAREKTIATLRASIDNPVMEESLIHYVTEIYNAAYAKSIDGNPEITAKITTERTLQSLQYGMQYGLQDKYIFNVTHKALTGKNPDDEDGNTINFYKFGNDFFNTFLDTKKSVLMGIENLETAKEQMAKGENVVFFANHQSEADPQALSIVMKENGFEDVAEKVYFVAGHKVTTDSLAIPFSMGRNLICIHSKKHLDCDPDSKPLKQKQNLAAMSGMLDLFRKGGAAVWVAPSGGRDRRDLTTGKVPVAPFDQKTIDMFRLMGNKSKVPTHYYAMSMNTYELCPPPDTVEAGVGEKRNVRYVPCGIYVSEELENVGGVETRHLFTENAFKICDENYQTIVDASSP